MCVCVRATKCVCVCARQCVCDTGVCGTRMLVRERTYVGMHNTRRIDRFRHFPKFREFSEILFANHPTLVLPALFLYACYGRELWHATNYIKVLGSERSSANTIWDYYIKSSIDIPLCYKKPRSIFAANSPGAVNSIACIVTEVYRLYKPFTRCSGPKKQHFAFKGKCRF